MRNKRSRGSKRRSHPAKPRSEHKSQSGKAHGRAHGAGSKHAEMRSQNFSGPRPALYGFHAVAEAWLNPARVIEALYITDNAAGGFEKILREAHGRNLKRPAPIAIDKHVLDKLLPPAAVHQGLALACAALPEIGVDDLIIRGHAQEHFTLLMLDQVTDPHNVGAILRSASAFACDGVIMQRKHAPELTGVLAKTACGAVEHIAVAYETNLSRALERLKEAGFFIYGLDERGTEEIGGVKPGGKSVLVLGAEGDGMRRLVREHCDALLRLPTRGAIQSLNVSNAAAIALYAFSLNRV